MSFVFRGTGSDNENGLSGISADRPLVRVRRRISPDKLASLISSTVLLIVQVLNSPMSLNFWLWVGLVSIFLMATILMMCSICLRLQAPAAPTASGLLPHTDFRLHMPTSRALTTGGRVQLLRLQVALLNREILGLRLQRLHLELLHRVFDDLERILDSNITSRNPSMSAEEINALPVHRYKMSNFKSDGSVEQQGSSSSALLQETEAYTNSETSEDELTCTICLEQVTTAELVRSLPCLHQFHPGCIDQWLYQQGTCPVCKCMVVSGLQESRESEKKGDDMV